jgi:hypothetical protein
MKEVRKHVIAAARFTLLVVGSASRIAGIVLLVSNNDAMSIIIFFSVFAVDPLAATHFQGDKLPDRRRELPHYRKRT